MTICGGENLRSTGRAGAGARTAARIAVFALALAFAVAVGAIGARDARADNPPTPQKLWRLFPLDAHGHSPSRGGQQQHAGTTTAAATNRRTDSPMSAAVWAATAAALVVALLAVGVIAGRIHVPVPPRGRRRWLRRPPIRERVAELVKTPSARPRTPEVRTRPPTQRVRRAAQPAAERLATTNGHGTTPAPAVRIPSRESEQAVLKRKGATKSADADEKLRAKLRQMRAKLDAREHELVLLKAKQERKP